MRLLVMLCLASSAWAGDAEEALQHFKKGTNAYRAGDLDEAVDELKLAVKLKPTPNGMYALGQALREKGDLAAAAHQYRQYLILAPSGPYAQRSLGFLAGIEEALAKMQAVGAAPPSGIPADEMPSPSPTPQPQLEAPAPLVVMRAAPPPRPSRRWVWGVVAATVAVVGLSVGLGVGLSQPGESNVVTVRPFSP